MLQTFQWDKESDLEEDYPPVALCFGIDGKLIPCLILSHAFKSNNYTRIQPIPQYVAPAPKPQQLQQQPQNQPQQQMNQQPLEKPYPIEPPPQQVPIVKLPEGPVRSVNSLAVEQLDKQLVRALNEQINAQQLIVEDFPTLGEFERRLKDSKNISQEIKDQIAMRLRGNGQRQENGLQGVHQAADQIREQIILQFITTFLGLLHLLFYKVGVPDIIKHLSNIDQDNN